MNLFPLRSKRALALAASLALLAGGTAWAAESQAALKAQAKISQQEAEKTALAAVPKGKIKSFELEKEDGKLVWSFDIASPGSKNITEIHVDALTGAIVSNKIETPADQAKEAAADKLEKKDKVKGQ